MPSARDVWRVPAPSEELLRRLAARAHTSVDELFDLATELRRELQDAEADLEAVVDQGLGEHDPVVKRALWHARQAAGALREVERQFTLALCDLVPPGAERAVAARSLDAMLRSVTFR